MEGGPIRPSQQIPLEWFASRGCSVFNGMPEAKKEAAQIMPFYASCTQCETRSHVPQHVQGDSKRPQVRGNEDLPLLNGPYLLSGAAFSPRRGPPQPMMLCVFAASNARSAHPGESSCKCTFWLCAGKTIASLKGRTQTERGNGSAVMLSDTSADVVAERY
ncbi:hypothetical protein NA56DRAFT_639906 [Hyaloscypha hepaticicola]|uniref:Uncharacterized protein n=1 Tax=Hyaloscypha hepaticicola TaxID=2082293 RepID=A0A2J6QPQ7_9HELO|nr:hypothetical protein NA56DRAFT_639906 [Hyaloscypha hepaticicola]